MQFNLVINKIILYEFAQFLRKRQAKTA